MESDISQAAQVAVEPAGVARILYSGGANSPKQPSPAEHLGSMASPTTSTQSRPSSSDTAAPKHDSAVELASDIRKPNRVSVSFPIQPSALGVEYASPGGRRASPSPLFDPTFAFPPQAARTPVPASRQPSPTDNGFLTALAAQERRVLELKEELHKAEQELDKLKRQWAAQESVKKRQDAHHVQPLRPLSTELGSPQDDDTNSSSAWTQKEMEKRKSIVASSKPTHRRVFSGSRHTRALSLLSPDKMNQKTFPSPTETKQPESPPRPPPVSRMNTAPDLLEQIRNTNTMDDITSPVSDTPKETFRLSRQMASDFKDGLWTFFEDLRQATVGDEGIVGPQPKTNRSSMKPPSKPTRNAEGPQKSHERKNSRPEKTRGASTRPSRPSTTTDTSPKTKSTSSPSRSLPVVPRRQSVDVWAKESAKSNPSGSPQSKVTGLRKKSQVPKQDALPVASDVEEPWDMWDTPEKRSTPRHPSSNPSQSSSTSTSTAATSSASAPGANVTEEQSRNTTPKGKRITATSAGQKDAIPWPTLQKLTPGNLKRTASNLMNEWERSITPPSADRKGSKEDYLSWPSPMNP
ncbi:hypothetical protein EV356DRAFT_505357 [Viridothelium virens]|uniref:DUF4048 domain-containing protein n=1 Tax=Viridothelium virens TaxID=1048519 RepID=A0A6A6H3E6_VIRVR|nr:hypothetical protein EV356DRAFT_505357 [Viridothelium virens]